MATLPPSFVATVTATFADGAAWLARLDELRASYAARWGLALQPHFANLSFNYVAPCTMADGTPAVLKLGVPTRELTGEIAALWAYDGHGAARLLTADAPGGALLIERLLPGTSLIGLAERDDAQATAIAARVMRDSLIAAPDPAALIHQDDWTADLLTLKPHFGGTSGPYDLALVDTALALRTRLLATTERSVLVHGDLHHDNILLAGDDEWRLIDPKGVYGDAALQPAAFLHNPFDQIAAINDLRPLLASRLTILADVMGVDRQRISDWALVYALLGAWWSYQDGDQSEASPANGQLRVARALLELTKMRSTGPA